MRDGEPLAAALEDILATLPGGYVVTRDDDGAHLAVGPSGAFVLIPLPPGRTARDDAARRVQLLAQETRAALGEHLAWVPFVDPLLISTGPLVRGAGVTVAPVDLLGAVLRDGPALIDRPTLASVARVVDAGLLGPWRERCEDGSMSLNRAERSGHGRGPAGPTADGRIELCPSPLPPRAVSPR